MSFGNEVANYVSASVVTLIGIAIVLGAAIGIALYIGVPWIVRHIDVRWIS